MFKCQIYTMFRRKGFQFSFIFMLLIAVFYPCFFIYKAIILKDDISTICDFRYAYIFYRDSNYSLSEYSPYLLTIISLFSFSYTYATDRKTNYMNILICRCGIKKYLFSKAFCCLIGGFLIIFIPTLINILWNIFFLPNTNNGSGYFSFYDELKTYQLIRLKYNYNLEANSYIFWIEHPILSSCYSAILMGILGAIFSLFTYSMLLYIENIRYSFISVVPTLAFFLVSEHLNEDIRYNKWMYASSINILDYAMTGVVNVYNPIIYFGMCICIVILSFILIFIKTRCDQI